MQFEFDPAKSAINKDKHGIDFVEAQALWLGGIGLLVPARSDGEERLALIGRIASRHWVGFFTLRGRVVRIISVRRARGNERKHYEDYLSRGTGQEVR